VRIVLTSIFVSDQEQALRFYTEVLGFVKRADFPVGDYRWLSVVSPEQPDGVELALEPDAHPAVPTYREALVADGIPATSFAVDDVPAEYDRLCSLGVRFTQEPARHGFMTTAVFDDTCGNLIQIAHRDPVNGGMAL
jgi:catechol 2,3-dioxygenase-like lactoylglutathione lyase family enzyme